MQTVIETATRSDQLPQVHEPRNDGMPLDINWVAAVQATLQRSLAMIPRPVCGDFAPKRNNRCHPLCLKNSAWKA